MSAKLKWTAILIISLVMTALTLLFLQKYLSEETQRRLAEAEPEGIAVVVFARTMQADEQVFAESLALREFPEHLISAQWLSQQEVVDLLGQRLKYDVEQGEPLTRAMLISNNFAGLSRQLPADHFAVTIPATEEARHNGLLAVGDKVDITFTDDERLGSVHQHTFTDLSIFDLGATEGDYGQIMAGITLLVPAADIAAFTRYQKDNYALSVRSRQMNSTLTIWKPVAPTARILSWQGEQ